MANTLIQLKYSTVTGTPTSLEIGEPAYSYQSNTLFIGTADGQSTLNIGGVFYTSQIDDATDSATGSTLVRRDAEGSASFNVITANTITAEIDGNANTATALETARFFNFTGDVDAISVSFDGTANADFTLELANTGVVANTYGGQTQIPVFTVDEDGRITSASNTSISTDLSIAADVGTNTVSLASDTLTIAGGDGVNTAITADDTITVEVDNTVIRTTGGQTIDGNLSITGNLNVTGNVVSFGAEDLIVNDPIIVLANNNTGNLLDIGYVGKYSDNGDQKELGLIHHAATEKFYLFTGYEGSVESTNILDINDPTITTGTIVANLEGGTVSGLSSAISVSDGGTGQNTFTTGSIIIGNGTGGLLELANTTSNGVYGNAAFVPVITVDDYGRVTGVTTVEIKIDMDDLTGILPVDNGGLGANTFTSGEQIVYNGTNFVSLANVTTTGSATLATSNTITSVTTDGYGRLTAFAATPIVLDTSQITTGTLGVARGGTGANTFTTNGVLLGQGTSALTTVSSSTEGHLLTINNSGVPVFSMLSGGTF
jgi:trimeric autotransporter adhesin